MANPSSSSTSSSGGLLGFLSALGSGLGSGLSAATAPYGGVSGLASAMLQDAPGAQGAAAYGQALQAAQNQAINRQLTQQQLLQQQLAYRKMLAQMPYLSAGLAMYYGSQPNASGDDSGTASTSGGSSQPQGASATTGAQSSPAAPANLTPQQQQQLRLAALQQRQVASGANAAPGATPQVVNTPSPVVGRQGGTPTAPPWMGAGASPASSPPVSAGAPGAAPAVAPPWVTRGPAARGPTLPDPMTQIEATSMLAAGGFPGAQTMLDAAKARLENDPRYITQSAAAKNQISQDLAQLSQAQASGDPQLIQGLTTKLRADLGQIVPAGMSGAMRIQQADGSWTIIQPGNGLVTNTSSGTRWLPGALAAEGQRAQTEEAARLRAATAPAGGTAAGTATNAAATAGAPASARGTPGTLVVPASKQGQAAVESDGYLPPILAAAAQQPQRPGNLGLAALADFQKTQTENAGKLADDLQEKAEDGNTIIAQAQQIEDAARDFTPGKWANVKGEVLAALQPTGVLSQARLNELGSYQEGQKLSIQLQAVATKQLGSREAAQVFSVMGKSIPNLTLSPAGLSKISAYLTGIAKYNIARSAFAQRLTAQDNVAGVNNLPAAFQTNSNPVFYILASAPPDVRQEMVASMAPAQAKQLAVQWSRAIQLGLAPRPQDYQGE